MDQDLPKQIIEFAARTVDQVRAAVGVELGYDSETLPVVDHYLRAVPREQETTVQLIAAATGAYFGEVVRRVLGGRWEVDEAKPLASRLILPWGLSFVPAGFVAAAIVSSEEVDGVDTGFHIPDVISAQVEDALARMSPVTEEEFYSLCGAIRHPGTLARGRAGNHRRGPAQARAQAQLTTMRSAQTIALLGATRWTTPGYSPVGLSPVGLSPAGSGVVNYLGRAVTDRSEPLAPNPGTPGRSSSSVPGKITGLR